MKIIIIGAGAMGSLYGAYLSKKHEVIMVDVMENVVQAVNENGICIQEEDGSVGCFKNNVSAYVSGSCDKKQI